MFTKLPTAVWYQCEVLKVFTYKAYTDVFSFKPDV